MAACSSVVKPSGAAQDEMMVNASLKMRGAGPASGRLLTVLNRHSTPNDDCGRLEAHELQVRWHLRCHGGTPPF
jgi:hypothetical protein